MDDSPPPRRKPDKLRAHREMRDRAVREIRALLDLYWDMCGSWCALDDHDDIELWRRMMNTRTHVMALVIALMPVPTADAFTEEELLPDLRAMHGMRETLAELRQDIIAAAAVICVLMAGAFVLHWWLGLPALSGPK